MENTKKYSWHGPKQIAMIVFTGALMLISASLVGGANNTVLPALAEARGWDVNLLNLVSGLACILDGLGVLLWARVTRKSLKRLTALCLFITAAMLCIYGTTHSLGVFFVTMFVLAFMSAGYSSTFAMSLTANWWPSKKGVVLGFSTMGIVLMQIVYVPVIPKLYAVFGIEKTEVILAAIVVVVAVISLIWVKDTPEEANETPDGLPPLEAEAQKKIIEELHTYKSPYTFRKIAGDINNWKIALSVGLPLLAAMSFISSTIPAMLSWGYDMGTASLVFSIGGVLALAGSLIFGVIDQKTSTKTATTIYIICMIGAIILTFAMPKSLAAVWVGGSILFSANGSGRNLLPSFVGTKYGRWDYAAAYQIIGAVGLVLPSVGIMLTGVFRVYNRMMIFDLIMLAIALFCARTVDDSFIGKKD